MGAYLSSPVIEKISCDKKCSRLSYGASSMQGWRVSQEDAHNCIVDFDEDTSFFAVYDGHGGAEVAKYCALHFPDCLRSVVSYKNGNLSQALEEAFLEFDDCLTKPEVIDELKHLSTVSDDSEDEDVVAEDAKALNEEAHMPLEDLLARYKGAPLPLKVKNYHNQKPKSPMLRAKKPNEILVNGDDCKPKLDRGHGDAPPCESGTTNGKEGEETSVEPSDESSPVDAEPGCSHPKERTKKEKKEAISGSEEDDDEEENIF